MLTIAGLGVYDKGDIPLNVVEAAEEADEILAETYTNIYHSSLKELEEVLYRKIKPVKRNDLEEGAAGIAGRSVDSNILVLVPGDPLSATTHTHLILEARKIQADYRVIHASSIFTAVAETGLQLYKFGKTTTLAYPQENYEPTSPYDVITDNQSLGLHTLILLDVKMEEDKYMSVNEALRVLLKMEKTKQKGLFTEKTYILACARLGADDSKVKYGKISGLKDKVFGDPPHCLVLPGELHFTEKEMLAYFQI